MVYMITYDLNKTGQDYDRVIEAIKTASTGVWCSFWKSSWLIQSNLSSATEVFKHIEPFVDSNDRIIVIEVNGNYSGFLQQDQWDYIKQMF